MCFMSGGLGLFLSERLTLYYCHVRVGQNQSVVFVTTHHQMRHKSQIQILRLLHNVIGENASFKTVKELCFYHNYKLNYSLRNGLYSGVANMRKMGLKIALFTVHMLIYIKLTYSQM